MPIKIALPKGRLLARTSTLLEKSGWGLSDYHEGARLYRLQCNRFPNLSAKIFHEKDIPVQVAIGNYDLGICGLDWIEELLAKYPNSGLVKIKNLGYGASTLYMTGKQLNGELTLESVQKRKELIRIASEYPNLAEKFALKNRLKRFNIFPVWGAAEAYPPENAELALISTRTESELDACRLDPVSVILNSSAFMVANKDSWESKDLSEVLTTIDNTESSSKPASSRTAKARLKAGSSQEVDSSLVRLALPDGHQQEPTIALLNKAGIKVDDYPSKTGNRRPTNNLDGVVIKVIRPQDMPLQVANGNFDLAITGKDWLREHLYQFPSSPVKELLDLKFGWVKIVAVVSNELPVSDNHSLQEFNMKRSTPLRLASEYVNIADKYARDNRLGMYKIIPTWGATEAFLPEDADLLIENTQTGKTLARHNLKIVDTLFESTACVVGNTNGMADSRKSERIKHIIKTLQTAVEEGTVQQ